MKNSKYWYGTVYSKHLYSKDLIKISQLNYAFIGPKHTDCSTKSSQKYPEGHKKDIHFPIYLKFESKISKEKIITWFSNNNLLIKYLHSSSQEYEEDNIVKLTKGIKQGRIKYYDFNRIRILNKSKVKFDYREFFPHKTFTKTALKRQRGWTDKCLTYLPKAHEHTKFNFQYGSVMSNVWSIYIIEKLESQEPIKSILAKKHSPKAKIKREQASKKRKQTVINKERQLAEQYHQKLLTTYQFLPKTQRELALVLAKLQVLNHLAKYLSDWKTIERINENNASRIIKTLTKKYDCSKIYKLKNQVLSKIFNDYSKYLKLSAYRPKNPDKYSVYYCDIHNEDRYFWKATSLEYLLANYHEIKQCVNCNLEIKKDYYTCYNFRILLGPNACFDFHIPYPNGKRYYPKLHNLPKIDQIPNESGPYLFGRESNNYENIYSIYYDLFLDIKSWLENKSQK